MKLTPRQIWAFLQFSNAEQANQLRINAVAAQGDDKLIQKFANYLDGRTVQIQRR